MHKLLHHTLFTIVCCSQFKVLLGYISMMLFTHISLDDSLAEVVHDPLLVSFNDLGHAVDVLGVVGVAGC